MSFVKLKYYYVFGIVLIGNIHGMFCQDMFKVEKLKFNSNYESEIAPYFYGDGIIFSSDRKSNYIVTSVDLLGKKFYNLFYTEEKDNGKWITPKKFAEELHTDFHEGATAISYDGKKIFFTRLLDIEPVNLDSLSNLGIFIAELVNEEWTNLTPFPYNNEAYNIYYPSINKEGNRLYFSSDMPGGYGNYDIYYSDLADNEWQAPVNLGSVVNTDRSEVSPFIHESENLYFASRGHDTIGKSDIFVTRFVDGTWKKPEKLQEPVNSDADDFAYIANTTVDAGYFTSNRDKSDDIYRFELAYPRLTECPVQEKNNYCFIFYEEGNIDLDTTTLSYEWDLGDGTLIRGLEAEHCFKGEGEYIIKLNVIDTLTGEVYYNEASYIFPIVDIQQAYIDLVDTCRVSESIKMNSFKTKLDNFRIENQYWYIDNKFLGTGPEIDYRINKKGIYYIYLGLLGTTDERSDLELKCVKKPVVVIE